MAESLIGDHNLSINRACQAAGLSRTAGYRRPAALPGDTEVIGQPNKVVSRWPRWGFWKCFDWLRGRKDMSGITSVYGACIAL